VATYVVGGRGSKDQAEARAWAYRDPRGFGRLIELLVETSIEYLDGQIRAGADVVQIFDSWAGCLPDDEFERWVVAPTARLVLELRRRHPDVPIIGFPRGAGPGALAYLVSTGVDGIGCDTAMPLGFMRDVLAPRAVVQGNLDPLLLVTGGVAMERRVEEILGALAGERFIFNLGHGIVPETPPENVERLVSLVRRAVAG
jgi:uroporphyrinogen decarboxylase